MLEVKFGNYGTLKAYAEYDPNYPGISIMFQPEGREEEIDIAYVKGVPTPEFNEKAGDICIYTYENPGTGDFTHKGIVNAEEIYEVMEEFDDD